MTKPLFPSMPDWEKMFSTRQRKKCIADSMQVITFEQNSIGDLIALSKYCTRYIYHRTLTIQDTDDQKDLDRNPSKCFQLQSPN